MANQKTNTQSESDALTLRPHHGMCLAFFEGKGYSDEFTVHMWHMLEVLAGAGGVNSHFPVQLVTHTDAICKACPNNREGVCRDEARVCSFDQGVLATCGLLQGQRIEFGEFVRLVQSQIIAAGKRQDICGGCQWEAICAHHASRWERT